MLNGYLAILTQQIRGLRGFHGNAQRPFIGITFSQSTSSRRICRTGKLKIVIQEIDDFNQLRTRSEKITKLNRNAGAEILIIGEEKPDSNGQSVYMRYCAFNVSKVAIPVTTDWYRSAYGCDRKPTIEAAEAIKQSAASN